MDRVRRLVAAAVTVCLIAGLAAGCGKDQTTEKVSIQGTESEEAVGEPAGTPLVIACGSLSGNFSEFYPETSSDRQVADLTAVYLLGTDRAGNCIVKGKKGETRSYNGTDYEYLGAADCSVKGEKDGKVKYTFNLRNDLKFSDGTPLTADDAIFSMYVYLDSAYKGNVDLGELPIAGLEKYRGVTKPLYQLMIDRGQNNTNFDVYTRKEQKKFYETDLPEAREQFIKNIMKHFDTKSVAEAMIALGYANKDESGRVSSNYTYNHWSMKGDDKPKIKDFLNELVYNASLDIVSDNLVKSGVLEKGLYELLPEKYNRTIQIGKAEAKSISGIKRLGDYKFSVTLSQTDPEALVKLAIPIQPLHYYGDTALYNYKKNKFGFKKGDLSGIKERSTSPLGAGPYIFKGYSDGVVYLEANPEYYKGAPLIKEIHMEAVSENEMAYEIVEGAVDIAEPSITKSDLEQLRKVNSNGCETGDVITTVLTDYPAYGYIGINAAKVNVGGQPRALESLYLRRAIATVLAYYRFESVHDYYGDTAELIEYPISGDSWASPHEWESGYAKIYRQKLDDSPVYTTRMTESEREEAVLEAALEYFEAAGYTLEKGKLKTAPAGAALGYSVMVTGYGEKDHPSYKILKKAKKALSSIGFTLKIRDMADSSEMFTECQTGNAQLWCAAWPAEADPDGYMYSLHHSKGGSTYMYGIESEDLDAMIIDAASALDQRERKKKYKKCLDYIRALVVEVPTYQRQNCTLYATGRFNPDSIPGDQTSNYNWKDEIEKLQMY